MMSNSSGPIRSRRNQRGWVALGLLLGGLLIGQAGEIPAAPLRDDVSTRSGFDRTTGVVPTDEAGRPLNLGFETGDLTDWRIVRGDAFAGQPIAGDTVSVRRGDMTSNHAGRFWLGGFERHGDAPRGVIESAAFRVTHPYATFLIAGGAHRETRVELVDAHRDEVIFTAFGDESEVLKPVAVDLRPHQRRLVKLRVIDDHSGHWGHINYDDFRFHDQPPVVPKRLTRDQYAHEGLDPQRAAEVMEVPEGFEVRLAAAEPEVRQPIALAYDDRGRLWVAEAYSYPIRVPADQARDRILIFEDTTGDGQLDSRKVFIEGLNLVSGLELGFGGVFVGAAPELLFIPDRDHDDTPDGPPQVLLDGWGYQDTHETLNAFIWGPDGWLYGCHGVFTHSRVGKPGTPDNQRVPINAGVWRYRPQDGRFEVFAEGTSNPWGVDFNDRGQAFITACVIPHLYHLVPGGRYQRQSGSHFNPHTYDDIKTIADHVHYVGNNPHGGNGRSNDAGGGHAHCGAMIYLGGAWPAAYRDQIFFNNIHGARINVDALEPFRSGYLGTHRPDFLLANDSWSQIVNLRYGPDGQVFMIDWYDRQQCHRTEVEVHDRSNGRIFQIRHTASAPASKLSVNLANCSNADLVAHQLHPNDWFVRHARRLLMERPVDPETRKALATIAFDHPDETRRLRGLWALHVHGGLTEEQLLKLMQDDAPSVRGWAARLSSENGSPAPDIRAALIEQAHRESAAEVRLELASAVGRWPVERRGEMLAALLAHGEDADDPNLPLMIWYALEPLAASQPSNALTLAARGRIPRVLAFATRRVASQGTPDALGLVMERVAAAEDAVTRRIMLAEINAALKGRRNVTAPPGWAEWFAQLIQTETDAQARSELLNLASTFGDPAALRVLTNLVRDSKAPAPQRLDALAALIQSRVAGLDQLLLDRLDDPDLQPAAIRALAVVDHPEIGARLIALYDRLPRDQRRDVLLTLAARLGTARELLDAVERQAIPASDLTADIVRNLRNHKNADLDQTLTKVWGRVSSGGDPAEIQRQLERYSRLLDRTDLPKPNVVRGKALFAKVCGQCHKLHGEGGDVGPELTGSNRGDRNYLLTNILNPNELIGKDYLAHVVALTDGRVITGIIRAETERTLTLVTANEVLTLDKSDIDERQPSDASMMPEGLLTPLTDQEVRDLIEYLARPAPPTAEELDAAATR